MTRITLFAGLAGIILILLSSFCRSDGTGSPDSRHLVRTTSYDMDIRIDYEDEKIEAECRMTVLNPFDHPVDRIPLLLYRLMRVDSVRDGSGRDLSYSQQVVSFEDWEKLQVNFIEIDLAAPLPGGEKTTLDLSYAGYLAGYTETGMLYVKDRVDPEYTVIRPDCRAYPEVGVPSWKTIRAAGLQEFDYTIRVTVPDSLTVANGGRLVEKTSHNGESTYVYQNILPAWRIDAAVADYGLLEDHESGMKVFYFKEDEEGARRIFEAMTNCMELYTDWFGPLAAQSEFSVIAVPEGFGSQADVTSVLQTRDAFLDPSQLAGLYHEISHLWNVKPLDPLPPRFESEGLAMFLQYLAQEKLENREGVLDNAALRMFEFFQKQCRENPQLLEIPMIDYGKERLTNFSYSKGMLFFYILHKMAGEDAFLNAIGSVYQNHHDSGASARDFLAHLEKELSLDLGDFYRDWVFSTEAAQSICTGRSFLEVVNRHIPRE